MKYEITNNRRYGRPLFVLLIDGREVLEADERKTLLRYVALLEKQL